MDKLQKRFDGFTEDLKGNFAIFPLRFTGRNPEGFKTFIFKPDHKSENIQVEWDDKATAIAVIPSDVAMLMVRLGYARNLSDAEVDQFNASVEAMGAETVDKPSETPTPVVPPAVPEVPGGTENNAPPAIPGDVPPVVPPAAAPALPGIPGADEGEAKKTRGRPPATKPVENAGGQ